MKAKTKKVTQFKVRAARRGFAKVARGFGGQLDETGAWTFSLMTASEFAKVVRR